ncbi:LuxR family transcriptional regulator [Catenovulum agarivorans DS-2]|uniref:LuxR family transcriptional regulator n=2 Tax=Catenovulum agarivorans TaxID=1172192 RepID=W7QB40_9ALTE|nr:LuxR family transcriptional regulator [Catenovulum agarivorans DS-2]
MQRSPYKLISLDEVWSNDLSGELVSVSTFEVCEKVIQHTPNWLSNWISRRENPISFGQVLRFIPFTGNRFLEHTGVEKAKPLKDILFIPSCHAETNAILIIGLHEYPNEIVKQELISLSLSYITKWLVDFKQGTFLQNELKIKNIELTKRETECLQWLIAGKTLQETATILSMSYANVRYHVNKAKDRNGYANTKQLMAHASIELKLSPLGPERS